MTHASTRPIRALVVEDSRSVRELLVRLIEADGRFQVVGTARDGEEAVVRTAELRPDVISMDVHLPELDGVAATRRIMAETPTPIVVVTASSKNNPDSLAFEALRAGALTVLDKPPGPWDPRHASAAREMLAALRLMAEVKVVRRSAGFAGTRPPRPALPWPDPAHGARPLAVMLAASTGGPQAIQQVLQMLGPEFELPVLVVQHMSPGFLDGMAAWLAATCPQRVRIARDGDSPAPGTVYVAPEDRHLLVTRRATLVLSKAPPVNGFRPAANVLFESAAECYAARAVGVVLTGMGEDGAAGLAALRAAGAFTIAQDESSSVVYGMPRAALAVGAVAQVLPLSAIGPAIRQLLRLKSAPHATDR